MPSSTPLAASSESTGRQSKVWLSASPSTMLSPAEIRFPPTSAPLSSLTSATGILSSRPYGSQKDHR